MVLFFLRGSTTALILSFHYVLLIVGLFFNVLRATISQGGNETRQLLNLAVFRDTEIQTRTFISFNIPFNPEFIRKHYLAVTRHVPAFPGRPDQDGRFHWRFSAIQVFDSRRCARNIDVLAQNLARARLAVTFFSPSPPVSKDPLVAMAMDPTERSSSFFLLQ